MYEFIFHTVFIISKLNFTVARYENLTRIIKHNGNGKNEKEIVPR